MKWFKHYSSARFDKKLTRLKNKYGLRGIGFYWSVLEAIAFQLETNKPLPDLEEDAQDLALFYNEDVSSIEEMAKFCIDEGLLERDPNTGRIMCLKLLMHLDNTMSSNPEIKVILSNFKKLEDNSNSLKQIRLDKTREEKKRKEIKTLPDEKIQAFLPMAEHYYNELMESVNPPKYKNKKPDLLKWAKELELLHRVDGRPVEEIKAVYMWSIQDPFWRTNILSAKKLRAQYNTLYLKMTNRPKQEKAQSFREHDTFIDSLTEEQKTKMLQEYKA